MRCCKNTLCKEQTPSSNTTIHQQVTFADLGGQDIHGIINVIHIRRLHYAHVPTCASYGALSARCTGLYEACGPQLSYALLESHDSTVAIVQGQELHPTHCSPTSACSANVVVLLFLRFIIGRFSLPHHSLDEASHSVFPSVVLILLPFSADPALLPERHSSHISSFLHAACALPIATKLCSQAQCTAMWSSSQSTQRHCWLHCCSGRLVKSRCSRAHGLGPRR